MEYSNGYKPIEDNTKTAQIKTRNSQPVQDLEAAFEALLDVIQDSDYAMIDKADSDKHRMGFEICLNDRLFQISIVQYNHTTEITPPPLSPRELEIARLITKGMQNKGIAYKLGLSPCTVSTYTKRIYLKLNVNSRAEMVAKVLNDFAMFF